MIRLESLSKSFGTQVISKNLDLQFPDRERVALVGPNGAGKTTLLNILTGHESADSGSVIVPARVKLGYLPQEPNPNPENQVLKECLAGDEQYYASKTQLDDLVKRIAADPEDQDLLHRYDKVDAQFRALGGYAKDAQAHAILSGLGFSEKQKTQHPKNLSGGWRMRLELAKIFLNNVDVLILDEPTNHLDLPSLSWVEQYLKSFKGTVIFVSHDRSLLNRLATFTYFLNNGQIETYPCAYDEFLNKRQERLLTQEAEEAKLNKKKEHLQSFIDRFGAKASKAKQAQSRVKSIERLERKQGEPDSLSKTIGQNIKISIPTPSKSGRQVLKVDQLAIGYKSDECLFQNLSMSIERGQKVAIIGANGIGKSTLLRTLAQQQKQISGDVLWDKDSVRSYFSQKSEDNLSLEDTVLENLMSSSNDLGERQARSILARFLFSSDDISKPTHVLSGGEKNRASLAKLLVSQANVMLLDEPTNHLDMDSIDALTKALQEYDGTVIFVSHDRSFIDAICSHIFVMTADGQTMLFQGKLEDYERAAPRLGFPNILSFDDSTKATSSDDIAEDIQKKDEEKTKRLESRQRAKSLKNKRSRLVKTIENLEVKQLGLQELASEIEKELSHAYQNNESEAQVDAINSKLANTLAELESVEGEWLESSQELETIDAALEFDS